MSDYNFGTFFRPSADSARQTTPGSDKASAFETNSHVMDEPFDLRKAVVYQTIMQNNYF